MTAEAESISRMRSQPMIHASSSPSVAYVNVYAEPATGTEDANSAYAMIARPHVTAARRKPIVIEGPALLAAAFAPTEKMPAPTATATPMMARSHTPRERLSDRPSECESASDASMLFVRIRLSKKLKEFPQDSCKRACVRAREWSLPVGNTMVDALIRRFRWRSHGAPGISRKQRGGVS
ncbi:hypothetical protein PSCLAVI8L_220020 [Pseudoclavibacter sp. 8L]|nr:hypothetical protein PSCLAVI8L_220020 [Pseudoclavibacter sp. 8L]